MIINAWFKCVHDTIHEYDIHKQDIYNMDETGFQMGLIATAKVLVE
jgi:hypothetical protein